MQVHTCQVYDVSKHVQSMSFTGRFRTYLQPLNPAAGELATRGQQVVGEASVPNQSLSIGGQVIWRYLECVHVEMLIIN